MAVWSGPHILKSNSPFDVFISKRSALVDYATPLVGDRSRAEDVVQEAFLRFAPTVEQGTTVNDPIRYLFRIVRNLAFDFRRRKVLERRQEEGEPEWWMVPAEVRTPEQDLIYSQAVDSIEAALATLAPDARRALELHRFGGFNIAEVADHMGWSKSKTHRILQEAVARVVALVEPEE